MKKRGRAASSMFGPDSESEDSAEKPPSRFRRVRLTDDDDDAGGENGHTAGASTAAQHAQAVEEDSLEVFMNNLKNTPEAEAPGRPRTAPREAAVESSDDEPTADWSTTRPELADSAFGEELQQRRGDRPARDLVLEPVNHASRVYPEILACGYVPLPRLSRLNADEKLQRLESMGGHIAQGDEILPVETFQDLALVLPRPLLASIFAAFENPTPIQQVAIPAALHGRNVIGVAKTGSGKTAAYAIPLLCHVAAQPRGSSSAGKGPRCLVVAPTRELAAQISGVVRKLGDGMKIGVMCVVGGHAKYEQFKRLRDSGAEVVVCTPGRFIDMVKMKACGLSRCSFVVLDEADRMFDMGFGPQVDVLLSQIRPDSQKLLFSATFPRNVAALVKSYVNNPVRITIGRAPQPAADKLLGEQGLSPSKQTKKPKTSSVPTVSENVSEVYVVVETEKEKEAWMLAHIDDFMREGLVIVFCPSRGSAASLANVIRTTGKPAACIHGETDPADREGLLRMFRTGELPLLVTTDLSARGLDIAGIRNVVNYGCAKSWDWHVHRVGRTGRASEKGKAYTLISKTTKLDTAFVIEAVTAFKQSGRQVPSQLYELNTQERRVWKETRPRGRGFRGRWR